MVQQSGDRKELLRQILFVGNQIVNCPMTIPTSWHRRVHLLTGELSLKKLFPMAASRDQMMLSGPQLQNPVTEDTLSRFEPTSLQLNLLEELFWTNYVILLIWQHECFCSLTVLQ